MRPQGTRRTRSRVLTLAASVLLLAGCASTIAGNATPDPAQVPPPGKPLGYQPSSFSITYADNDSADQVARDALDDIITYYKSFYNDVFGHDFTPPAHYYSIEPGSGDASGCMDGPNDESVVDNAFYCPSGDEVTYYRPLLDRYDDQYSDVLVGLVLAHEMGHAIQAREGIYDVRSIVAETQADCFAGTWARSVADKKDVHFKFDPADLDETLQVWAIELRSDVGSDPNGDTQHGSAFDRVSALQEGYEDGPTACRDNFNDNRLFTSIKFDEDNVSSDGLGNASYQETINSANTVFNEYFANSLSSFNVSWSDPKLLVGGSGDSSCPADRVLSYCAANNSVVISDEDALRKVHDDYGDYAQMTALGLAYGMAAIVQLKYSESDPRAITAAACLTGALSGELIDSSNAYKLVLSPGDFDEATVLLLFAGADNDLIDTGTVSAFDRMDAFRNGVNGGVGSCGISA